MTKHSGATRAAGPVIAGAVFPSREGAAVGGRSGQDIVAVRLFAAAVDHLTLLAEVGLLGDVVAVAMQIIDALGDHDALGVLPWTLADAVARVHGAGPLGAEIGVP